MQEYSGVALDGKLMHIELCAGGNVIQQLSSGRVGPAWDRDLKGVTLPDLLYEASPWLRLITIFRDPVDRYYSAFYYYR
ncbi:sulfotransfer_1 domain-containing protein [Haematococcus lacustris]|uniref:Sulfotransfer_1 domain-containing protein n=1 Tax=Haematococcus lacustris TaxID=44745 RepID=A0A6A0A3W2_HAELA|nr:sulfotransfer_1 domain-containing protein [Haematococcus lacustris]